VGDRAVKEIKKMTVLMTLGGFLPVEDLSGRDGHCPLLVVILALTF
jgi:hypothetical protein